MTRATHHKPPLVSIIISVYNGAATINQALSSITSQTFTDYEIILINDHSTDKTSHILTHWQSLAPNHVLKIITNSQNLGLTKSLNKGIRLARGKYIARLDADDWWHPEKLAKQVKFITTHPEYGVIGSYYMDIQGQRHRLQRLPVTDQTIKLTLFRHNPFAHSCVLINKQLLYQVNCYDESVYYGQDCDLWFRLLPYTKFYNLPKILCYRETSQGISNTNSRPQMWQGIKTRLKFLRRYQTSLFEYFYILEPIIVIFTPRWLKLIYRRLRTTRARPSSHTSSPKQNIAFLNDRFLPNPFAESVARLAMAKALAKYTHHNHLLFVFLSLKPNPPSLTSSPAITEYPITGPYLSSDHLTARAWNQTVFSLNTIRLAFTPLPSHYQIIYARCGIISSTLLAIRNYFRNSDLIFEVHNFVFGKQPLFYDALYRFIFNHSTRLVTISNFTRSNWLAAGIPDRKIIVTPSAVNTTAFHHISDDKMSLRQQLGLPLHQPLLVYTGHLYRDRDVESIISAATLIKHHPSKPHFIIVGGLPTDAAYYQRQLNQTKLNNISLLGHHPISSIPKYLKAADIILVTYSRHCRTVNTMSPMKLFEAFAAHRPIIAANLPRIRSIVTNSAVFFYTPDNANSLYQTILQILSDPNEANQRANLAFQLSHQYTWDKRVSTIMSAPTTIHD